MTQERIDIEVTDKVSEVPAKKLREIASAATQADTAIDRLKASMAQLDGSALTRLSTASAKLTNAHAREMSATARLESARAKLAVANDRVAIQEQRLATATAQAEAAQQRAATATAQAAGAAARAEAASMRLAAAKRREAAATVAATGATVTNTAAQTANAASAALSSHQIQNLTYQINDVGVSLASGQSPFMVMLQQGSQISTVFGPGTGVTGILRGLGQAVFSIARTFAPVLAVVGVAAAGFGILTNEINKTTDVGVTMGDTIKATLQLIGESIYNFVQPAITAMAPWFQKAYDFVIDATKFVVNGIVGYWVGTFNAIKVVWDNFPAIIRDVFALSINGMLDVAEAGMTGVVTTFSGAINNITGLFVGGYNAIIGVWGLLPDAFYNLGVNAMNGIIGVVEAGIKGIIGAIDTLLTFIGSAAELVGADNPFANLLNPDTLVDLSQYEGTLRETGAGIAETINAGFTDAFATDYAAGLVQALDLSGYRQEVTGAASDAASAVSQAYQDAFSADYAGSAFEAIRQRAIQLAEERIAAEEEADTATQGSNASLSRKAEILRDIRAPLTDYLTDQRALVELLREGAITAGQFNQALSELALVQSLQDVDSLLVGTPFADSAAIDEIRQAEQERLNIVQLALEARIIAEEDAAARVVAINRQAAADIQAIETSRQTMMIAAASDTFGTLAEAAKTYAGEQSGIYKALFAVSKGFAVAEAIIKTQQGVAAALASGPPPLNFISAGLVAAKGAATVATIAAQGFADGGRVVGPGGPRTDSIPAMLSDGEFVVNARAAQRNLPFLEAMNNNRAPTRQYADGGRVQASAYSAQVPRVGTAPQLTLNSNPNINIYTRDPDTRVEMTTSQVDAMAARRVNRGQRNL